MVAARNPFRLDPIAQPVAIALAASVIAYDPALVPSAFTNILWNILWLVPVWALTAWYIYACAANCAAVSADTSSAVAGTTPVVGANAVALRTLIAGAISCKAPATDTNACGCVVTNGIKILPSSHFSRTVDGIACGIGQLARSPRDGDQRGAPIGSFGGQDGKTHCGIGFFSLRAESPWLGAR